MEGMGKCDGRTKLETMILPPSELMLNLPVNICFVALRLRAKLAQTGNPTHVPPAADRGDSDSDPAC